jgi:hypothetical protein
MFFEFDELKTVLKNTLNEKFTELYAWDNVSDHTSEYNCPKCDEIMKEEEFGFNSWIHIDRCNICMSIFLNGNESWEINRYLSSLESEDVQILKEAKIEAEYEQKWKIIIQKMFKKLQQDWLL